ncbi:MAG TPA: hypothetical protein VGK73_37085, partial [Polyangiaceae bacterium]
MALDFAVGRVAVSGVLLALVGMQACGGSSDERPPTGSGNAPSTGGRPPTSGRSGGGDAGEEENVGGTAGAAAGETGSGGSSGEIGDPRGPVVTITMPAALESPNDGGVLVASEVDVR